MFSGKLTKDFQDMPLGQILLFCHHVSMPSFLGIFFRYPVLNIGEFIRIKSFGAGREEAELHFLQCSSVISNRRQERITFLHGEEVSTRDEIDIIGTFIFTFRASTEHA